MESYDGHCMCGRSIFSTVHKGATIICLTSDKTSHSLQAYYVLYLRLADGIIQSREG